MAGYKFFRALNNKEVKNSDLNFDDYIGRPIYFPSEISRLPWLSSRNFFQLLGLVYSLGNSGWSPFLVQSSSAFYYYYFRSVKEYKLSPSAVILKSEKSACRLHLEHNYCSNCAADCSVGVGGDDPNPAPVISSIESLPLTQRSLQESIWVVTNIWKNCVIGMHKSFYNPGKVKKKKWPSEGNIGLGFICSHCVIFTFLSSMSILSLLINVIIAFFILPRKSCLVKLAALFF